MTPGPVQSLLAQVTSSFAFTRNPLPLWIVDPETLAFVAVNDAAVSRYGYPRERFLAMRISDIRPPEDAPRLLEALSDRSSPASRGSGATCWPTAR